MFFMQNVCEITRTIMFVCVLTVIAADQEAFQPLTADAQEWLLVGDRVTYVYSGYWEHQTNEFYKFDSLKTPYLKVLMTGPYNDQFTQTLMEATCEFYFEEFHMKSVTTPVVGVHASVQDDMYPENESRPYVVFCNVPTDIGNHVPKAFSINFKNFLSQSWATDSDGHIRRWLIPIRGNYNEMHPPFTREKRLMVCVKPIFGQPFEDIKTLLNFFILNSALGIQHFLLWDAGDGSPKFYNLVNRARKVGISIEIKTWNFRDGKNGWMFHQTLQGISCLHEALIRGFEHASIVSIPKFFINAIS
jgi:hypothetical protein